jgi:hypothetical protein
MKLPTLTLALLAFLLLAVSEPTLAQEVAAEPPQTSALNGLARRLSSVKPGSGGGTATHFTPSGKRLTLDALADGLGSSAEEKSGLKQVFQAAFTSYETEAKKNGLENDVAGALAFYLCVHYSAYHNGQKVRDGTTIAVARQLQAALDTDEMRAANDAEKQKLYEFCVMMGGFSAAMTQLAAENKDAETRKQLREVGANGLRSILKIEPAHIQITDAGLVVAQEKGASEARPTVAPVSSRPSGGTTYSVSAISYRLPTEWTETKANGAVTLKRSFTDQYTNDVTMLILSPGWEKTGRINTAFPDAWRELILPVFNEAEEHPFVYVRRLGKGLNCAFAFGNMKAKSNGHPMTVFLYLLDTGKRCYPIIGMFIGNQSKFMKDVEQIFAGLTIAGASPPAPLVTAGELVGEWSTSSREYASYIDRQGNYRGDASNAMSVALTFRADGTYSSGFRGISSGAVTREKSGGTYKIEGDMLVLYSAGGRVEKKRFLGLETLPSGKGKMMVLLNPAYELLSGSIGLYKEEYVLVPK